MSEPEPNEELDTNVTANLSGPPKCNGADSISDKKIRVLSTSAEFVDGGKGRKGEKNDDGVKMAVDAGDGRNEWNDHTDVDKNMTEAEDAEKDDDVKMAEAEDANITRSHDTKMAEHNELKKEQADGLRKQEDDALKMEEAENMKEKEPKNTEKEEANDSSKEEDEDTEKEEAESVKNEKVESMKTEEYSNGKNEEANDMKKEEVENMIKEEVDSVHDVEMEDKKAEEKSMVEDNTDLTEETDTEDIMKKVEENKIPGEAERLKKKRNSGQKAGEQEKVKEKKHGEKKAKEEANDKKEVEKMAKEASTPVGSSIERPVRERKSVERLVEVLETESVKPFVIEKGRGTTLKDIPNVEYKLSKKKPAELTLLHRTLFGRVGKAIDYKNHILQFSGFVWHESEDKRKTKVKEKLDKCVKDTLLDFCELFDIHVSKAKTNARKEELVAMLLDFMVAPHATTDVILSEKEQLTKSKKRRRAGKWSGSKSSDLSRKQSRKESVKSIDAPKTNENSPYETEDEEEEEDEKGVAAEEDAQDNSESMEKESESEAAEEDDKDNDDSSKGKQEMKSPKIGGLADAKKSKVSAEPKKPSSQTTVKSPIKSEPKKISSPTTAKSPIKSSSSKHAKSEDKTNRRAKVVLRKHKDVEPPKKKTVSSKTDPKEKAFGKNVTKSTAKSRETGPSKEELRKTIIEILSKVDFNTATFTDILKELASHYGMDFTPRKAAIKLMIQEELTKLAEAEDESEDESEDEEDEGDDK